METVASVAAMVLPMWQSRHQHDEALKVSNELHRQAIELNQWLHKEEMEQSEQLFAKDCALERELHYGQASHDFDIARREGVRDAWSQRSQLLQTLMIVDTIMFSSAYSLLIQGDPPTNSPLWALRLYAASLCTSLVLHFVSVWSTLKLQTRLSQYNMHRQDVTYACGSQHRYFNEYFACHCKSLSSVAFLAFYFGTMFTILSAALYGFLKMYYHFTNRSAGIVFVALLGVAAALPFLGGFIDAWRKQMSYADDDRLLEGARDHAKNLERENPVSNGAASCSDSSVAESECSTPREGHNRGDDGATAFV